MILRPPSTFVCVCGVFKTGISRICVRRGEYSNQVSNSTRLVLARSSLRTRSNHVCITNLKRVSMRFLFDSATFTSFDNPAATLSLSLGLSITKLYVRSKYELEISHSKQITHRKSQVRGNSHPRWGPASDRTQQRFGKF